VWDEHRGRGRLDHRGIDAFEVMGGAAVDGQEASGRRRFGHGVLYGRTKADASAKCLIDLTGTAALTLADLVKAERLP
jgi:hypothetical protein